jgi:transposase-like protein
MNDNTPSTTDQVTCPDCGSARVQKYGKNGAGAQRYRCLQEDCRRQFVPGSDHLIDPEIKALVLRMINAEVHPRKIYIAVNPDGEDKEEKISLRWIYKLMRRIKNDQLNR